MNKIFCLILTFILTLSAFSAYADTNSENISVIDYSGILTDKTKEYVKSKNDTLFSGCNAKIIFVTVPGTDGVSIEDYTASLYKEMRIAHIGRNNNVFFVIDTNKNEYSFVIGKNIRYALTETMMYKYIVDTFEPEFGKKQYEKAVVGLYNSVGKWYEDNYNGLSLNLDDKISKYAYGTKTKDTAPKSNLLWLWIGLGCGIVAVVIILKIKHDIQLRMRKMERRRQKRKFQIDIDKIVNS